MAIWSGAEKDQVAEVNPFERQRNNSQIAKVPRQAYPIEWRLSREYHSVQRNALKYTI